MNLTQEQSNVVEVIKAFADTGKTTII
jgi:hypothetical protein